VKKKTLSSDDLGEYPHFDDCVKMGPNTSANSGDYIKMGPNTSAIASDASILWRFKTGPNLAIEPNVFGHTELNAMHACTPCRFLIFDGAWALWIFEDISSCLAALMCKTGPTEICTGPAGPGTIFEVSDSSSP
jgi:hypothetical protein